jgi:energy-converting hydrogenase A subunit R
MSPTATSIEPQKILVSDCEGPISKNDNAFELASKIIPKGDSLFTLISRYDDVLADLAKRESYKAGDTLKLILPFLKAYGATNKTIAEYSTRNILLVPGSKETLQFIRGFMPTFIVSTSYEQYMRALCNTIDFPFKNVYCTRLDLDKYKISEEENTKLQQMKKEMEKLPIPEIPKDAKSLQDLPKKMQQTVQRLDEIFWENIASMKIGKVLNEVNPVGGFEKTAAIKDIAAKLKTSLNNVIYVGDSITDVQAFQLVGGADGLTISFNGNSFAVREAEITVVSENTVVTSVLAYVFNRFGKRQFMSFIREWKPSTIEKLDLYQPLKKRFLEVCGEKFPRVELVTSQNMERLMQESTDFRKSIRGEAIGRLG